jgi:hypothetical protein
MIDISVDPPDLALLARVLKDIGDKDLSRELYRGLNRVTTELKADAKAEAGRRLPHRGGLAARVAGAKLSTSRARGGVSIRAKGMAQLARMDDGQVKHPVFGNRDRWVTQEVTGGWFMDPMEAGRPEVTKAVVVLLNDLAEKAVHRLAGF